MPEHPISHEQYREKLCGKETVEKALTRAHENRQFEIELYWKRAAYFWTFIGAAFAGYFAVETTGRSDGTDLSVVLACLGVVFSFAWFCVNRGSKKWQENWEKHVDLLEDEVTGPLYKIVLQRNRPRGPKNHMSMFFSGPASWSVSKINQLISFYVFCVWLFLLVSTLAPFDLTASIDWSRVVIVALTALGCLSFVGLGGTYKGGYWHRATIRTSEVCPLKGSEIDGEGDVGESSG